MPESVFQIDTSVLLALVGVFTGFLTLLTVLVRLLLKLTKQSFESQQKLTQAYESHAEEIIQQNKNLVEVITNNNNVLLQMKVSLDSNTKATEKSFETIDRLKDFITQNIIQSTR